MIKNICTYLSCETATSNNECNNTLPNWNCPTKASLRNRQKQNIKKTIRKQYKQQNTKQCKQWKANNFVILNKNMQKITPFQQQS